MCYKIKETYSNIDTMPTKTVGNCGCVNVVGVSSLDKLEQLRKSSQSTAEKLRKRARSKYVSTLLTQRLIELNSPNKERYIKSLSCATILTHSNGKITSKYCGSRWCMVCNKIRTGKYINLYAPILEKWTKTYLVTLTLPNCAADLIGTTLKFMGKTIRAITDVFRKRSITFRAVRKLEITYNEVTDSYHPHYHFIVEGESQANSLKSEWLKRVPTAVDDAQDVSEFDGNLKEIFKYVTKLFSKEKETKEYKKVNLKSLDIILRSLHGKRTLQNYGFTLSEDISEEEPIVLDESLDDGEFTQEDNVLSEYQWYGLGWVNQKTGYILSSYELSYNMSVILYQLGISENST